MLMLAAVLTATSVLQRGKVQDTIAVAFDLSQATRQFREKYRALPGDDPIASTQLPATADNGDGDGLIQIAAKNEPDLATDNLARAGLIRVGPNGRINSQYGDVWLMSYSLAKGANSPCGAAVDSTVPEPTSPNVIVFSRLPADVAREIDGKFDDGNALTGAIRASSAYVSGTTIACFSMPL